MNQIDYIAVGNKWMNSVSQCRSFWGTFVDTDHAMVVATISLKLKKMPKKKLSKRLDVSLLKNADIFSSLRTELTDRLTQLDENDTASAMWTKLQKATREVSEKYLLSQKARYQHWISGHTLGLSEQRRLARINGDTTRARELARQVRRSVKKDRENYWNDVAEKLERAAASGNSRKIFQLVREHSTKKSNPVSETILNEQGEKITDCNQRMERWVRHFNELLNRPTLDELLIPNIHEPDNCEATDHPPTIYEVLTAINRMKNNKACGPDGLPAEVLKVAGLPFAEKLQDIFVKIWNGDHIPDQWCISHLVPLHKKGDVKVCGNYRGISLLCISYKVLENIILQRHRSTIDSVLTESQAGFRKARGCIDQIYSLRRILEQRHEFRRPTAVCFVDFTAAFDSVHRPTLWQLLRSAGVPQNTCNVMVNMYFHTSCKIKAYNDESESFNVLTGVRQGGILSPVLFLLAVNHILKTIEESNRGIVIWPSECTIENLAFADDIAIIADSLENLNLMTSALSSEAAKLGLNINCKKTKLMKTADIGGTFTIYGVEIENVDDFCYLGSQITTDGSAGTDVTRRINLAWAAFNQLTKLWKANICLKIKMRILKASVLTIASYASETWNVLQVDIHRLDVFFMKCLRIISRIRWQDHVSNAEVMRKCGQDELFSGIIKRRQWSYLGHVLRMNPSRYPKMIFMSQPDPSWKRPRGGVKLSYERLVKKRAEQLMRPFNISRTMFEAKWKEHLVTIASDRKQWRAINE